MEAANSSKIVKISWNFINFSQKLNNYRTNFFKAEKEKLIIVISGEQLSSSKYSKITVSNMFNNTLENFISMHLWE